MSSNVPCLRPKHITVQITLIVWYNSYKWLLRRGSYETDAFTKYNLVYAIKHNFRCYYIYYGQPVSVF